MDHPTVTVGLPVFNDPEGLRRTVPSVFGQTWQGQVRLLVLDDGSTDETPRVLAELAEFYGPIEVVRSEVNRGRPVARNTILEHAGEDYLAWIDAGDLWHPRKLELQMGALLAAEQREPGVPLLCTGPLRWVFADRGEDRLRVPQLAGDQLRQALLGRIFPYLQALVGRAEHFRATGGFDEQLLRRQDYDFLVRFLGAGGKVVGSPEHIPVFTYLKSDRGARPEVVAAANRVIRAKHADYYRRYGSRLARQVRNNQDRLVARFYRHNGKVLPAAGYGLRAWLSRPRPPAAARPLRRAAGAGQAVLRRGAKVVLRPAVRGLRRAGAGGWAQRVGPLRRLAGGRVVRVLSVPPPPRPVRDPDALSASLTAPGARSAPAGWLRLAGAYRQQGRLFSAEQALRQALERHPDDVSLRAGLVELLPLRRKWDECVRLWGELDRAGQGAAGPAAHLAAARSLRQLGDAAGARAVAEPAARRWPHEPALREELYLNRAALVDWREAVTAVGDAAGDPAGDPAGGRAGGVVTELGFLAGGEGPIEGRAAAATAVLSLVVNGTVVATTGAASVAGGEAAGFSLSCHGMLPYLGDGDQVWVEDEHGRPLEIQGYGTRCQIRTGYPSRFPALAAKVAGGHVFTKFGVLRMGNTGARKQRTLALFQQVSQVLAQEHGYPAYPFYGNLLGAVREHDFIGHDVGGFDMGYISRHHTPEQVRSEFLGICRTLLDRGYHLRFEPWSAYVRDQHTSRAYVDINYAWFSEAGELQFSFGWRYAPVTDQRHVRFPRECPLAGQLVPVPGNAEAVLEQLYGPGWAVPDQGFALDAGLKRDVAYLLTEDELREIFAYAPDQVLIRSVVTVDGQVVSFLG